MTKKHWIMLAVVVLFAVVMLSITEYSRTGSIQCVPDISNNEIVISQKNVTISNIYTKFGNLELLQRDRDSYLFSISEFGTEYIRVEYDDQKGKHRYTVFEVVVTAPDYLITVAQYNEAGAQISFAAY